MADNPFYRCSRVFIIDDDLEDQEIFIEAVMEVDKNIQCYAALSGEAALSQLEDELVLLPDIIFLDLNLPKLNGKEILRKIKNHRSLKNIPVIMYSTFFAPADIEEVSQLGAAYLLLKPTKFADLCKSLVFILSQGWRESTFKITSRND